MRRNETKENLLYLGIWVLLFLSPIISMSVRMTDNSGMEFNWQEILRSWRVFVPYLIAFLIHNFLIAPLLIYKKKSLLYVGLALCVVVVFQTYACNQRPHFDRGPRHEERAMAQDHDGPPQLPGRPPMRPDDKKFGHHGQHPHPHHGEKARLREDFREPPFIFGQHDLVALIVMILMLGMNLGVKLYFKTSKDAKMLEELERKNLQQQLEYLKYQINPHFFMNTLNNIHALVDIEPEEAKSSIVELSRMMRYVLYESAKSMVPLSKDIDFIQHYITLMRLRYTDKVKINVDIADNLPPCEVAPMIFITFVENAFKHGVSYKQDCFINVTLNTKGDDRLVFTCSNKNLGKTDTDKGGVGLQNTRRRLDLIYGDTYHLDIDDTGDTYLVTLEIPCGCATQ